MGSAKVMQVKAGCGPHGKAPLAVPTVVVQFEDSEGKQAAEVKSRQVDSWKEPKNSNRFSWRRHGAEVGAAKGQVELVVASVAALKALCETAGPAGLHVRRVARQAGAPVAAVEDAIALLVQEGETLRAISPRRFAIA